MVCRMGCGVSLLLATTIPLSYVGLIYAFDYGGTDRNDPSSVKKRFVAAGVNNVAALALTYYVLRQSDPHPLSSMGFRVEGALAAVAIPALLTGILYAGTWLMTWYDGHLGSMFDVDEWRRSARDITWVRNSVMAPLTEEIAFRACSAALLARCLDNTQVCLLAPLTFALSHMHHVADDRRKGVELSRAIAGRGFQAVYTYVFGAYATYLFLSTGHILAPIITHSMCNNLGLPMFGEIGNYTKRYQRVSLWAAYVGGLIGFSMLVAPLTQRHLYQGW